MSASWGSTTRRCLEWGIATCCICVILMLFAGNPYDGTEVRDAVIGGSIAWAFKGAFGNKA